MPDMPTARPDQAPLVDDAAAKAAAAHLRARLDADDAGALDPDMHAHGIALACHRMERGDPGFYAVALSIASELRAEPNRLRRLLRPWYEGARDMLEDHDRVPAGVDGPDAVRAALRAIAAAPAAHRADLAPQAPPPPPEMPDPLPGLLDAPDEDAPGWEAALTRAEHAAARPAPTPSPPARGYEAPAAARDADTEARDILRKPRKSGGYRFSDLMWGAFFVPAVLAGLVAFLFLLAMPPISWATGLSSWEVRGLAYPALLGIVLWSASLSLLFPPVWYAWRRGWRGWIWPMLAAAPVMAILIFISTLIMLRNPAHPDFMSTAIKWVRLWGPITGGAALSIAFGSRLRGLSRRIFRRIGRWWDRFSGSEGPR